MATLMRTTVINRRIFREGTEFLILDSRVVKKGHTRVTIRIDGITLSFNIEKGHWMFDFLSRTKVGEIVDESTYIEYEKTTGEDRKAHLEVMLNAIEMGLRGERITVGDIFEWHRKMFDSKGHGGKIRTCGAYAAGSLHRYVEPDQIRNVLYNLVDYYNWEDSSWESIAEAHYLYEDLHAWYDGTGRTGRVLLNWHCVYTGHNPVCIRFEDRSEYITLLEDKDIAGLARLIERSELR